MPQIVDYEVLRHQNVYLFNVVIIPEVFISLYRYYDEPNEEIDSEYCVQWYPKYSKKGDRCHDPVDSYRPIELFLCEIIGQ